VVSAGHRWHRSTWASRFRTMETQANFGALLKKQGKYEEARRCWSVYWHTAAVAASHSRDSGHRRLAGGSVRSPPAGSARDTLIDTHKDLVDEHADAGTYGLRRCLSRSSLRRQGDAAKAGEWAARAASQPAP
jgi:hypothetical protein